MTTGRWSDAACVSLHQAKFRQHLLGQRFCLEHEGVLLVDHSVAVQHKVQPAGREIAVSVVPARCR